MAKLFFTSKHRLLSALFTLWLPVNAQAQITLEFQGAEPGDTWGYTSTGADATATANAHMAPNIVTGTASLVAGGNTGGGSCIDGGSGSGSSVARTFTFNAVNIASSNHSVRTLKFNWGNRFPICNGTGWDSGENLVFTAYHDGVAQPSVTLATGISNATFSIQSNQYTHNIPTCVSQFYFRVSITTNRRDELLFLDNVSLTTPALNLPVLQPAAINGPDSVCTGTNHTYNVTPETGISYTWSGLPTGATFTSPNGTTSAHTMTIDWGTASPGNYTIQVVPTDLCGTTTGPAQSATVTIVPNTTAAITPGGPTTFCAGNSVILAASTGTDISWSTGETDSAITVTTSGTYVLTINGFCGSVTATENITVNPSTTAHITASEPTIFCPGGSVVLTSDSLTGNNWSTGETTPSITADTTGFYILTVTGICGTASDTTEVTVEPVPSASISLSGPTAFCPGGSVTLTSSDATGNLWSTGDTGPSITVSTTGTYTLTVTETCGTATTSESITVYAPTTAGITTSGLTTFCAGDSVTLTSTTGTGNSWSTGDTTTSITVNTAGVYTLTVTGICGTATASETIVVNPLPSASISGTLNSLCVKDSVLLTANGGSTYVWSNGNTGNTTYGFAPGTYTVTATNGCGTATSLPYNISLLPDPVAQISGDGILCPGSSLNLVGSGGLSYLWSTGSTGTTVNVTVPGDYILEATNGCGSDTAMVHIYLDNVNAGFTASPLTGNAPLTVDFTNTSTPGIYTWDFGNGSTSSAISPSTVYNNGGTYVVMLTAASPNGCQDLHRLTIEVVDMPSAMIIPNIFSPNGDHINDVFKVNAAYLETFEASIFNRWGEEVIHWTDWNTGWDGTDKSGNAAAEGTYFYVIVARGNDNKEYKQNGQFTLVR